MPLFPTQPTQGPLTLTLEFDVGAVVVTASDRDDASVEVLPQDPARETDVRAAEQTRASLSGTTLAVKGPRKRSLFGRPGALRVLVGLPAGSHVRATVPMADMVCEGPLGDVHLKTSLGDLTVESAARTQLKTSHGDIRIGRATGDTKAGCTGRLTVGEVTGAADLSNLTGETAVGRVTGELRAASSDGTITVDVALATVDVRSARGSIHVTEAVPGAAVTLKTAMGDIEVGVPGTTAAWLDLATGLGRVRNDLAATGSPAADEATVEIRARADVGDIVVHRV
ncbi:DUF4097 family beta strand repeat-containing protein [Streptomyces avicenniae]|uniref:DUF4097 family beta strand repeat-containing protein n=1 Tax=Streptomyces avicenniae TaxID=500153 RepID=UPI00069AA253|nr:DUF4097 family beta strand repeat-containing protein [Streptomyces avicenniae]